MNSAGQTDQEEALRRRSDSAPVTIAERIYRAAAPAAFAIAGLAARMAGAGRDELDARVGIMPDGGRPLVWFHGASAGEMAAAVNLAALLRDNGFAFTEAYTAANAAGVAFASQAAEQGAVASFAPWDVPRWVARAFDRWRPRALFLVETEIWPALILEAARRGVPVLYVNARVYPHDVARYRVVRMLIGPTLRRVGAILAQSETERDRLLRLGADPRRCVVAGNLKYVRAGRAIAGDAQLKEELGVGLDDRLVVCGSVHRDEIPVLFAAFERLPNEGTRLVIAPRHPSTVAMVMKESQRRHWDVCRRTDTPRMRPWRVLAVDTVGELPRLYALASVAVVGGGFRKHGGHNPFEPIVAGAPVILGTHFHHFSEEARALALATPEARVAGGAHLGRRLDEWLTDHAHRERVLERQRRALPDSEAIAKRYLAVLSPWLRDRGVEV